jgi:hypothetical protein
MRTKEKNSIVANSINIKKEKKRKEWRFYFCHHRGSSEKTRN